MQSWVGVWQTSPHPCLPAERSVRQRLLRLWGTPSHGSCQLPDLGVRCVSPQYSPGSLVVTGTGSSSSCPSAPGFTFLMANPSPSHQELRPQIEVRSRAGRQAAFLAVSHEPQGSWPFLSQLLKGLYHMSPHLLQGLLVL